MSQPIPINRALKIELRYRRAVTRVLYSVIKRHGGSVPAEGSSRHELTLAIARVYRHALKLGWLEPLPEDGR